MFYFINVYIKKIVNILFVLRVQQLIFFFKIKLVKVGLLINVGLICIFFYRLNKLQIFDFYSKVVFIGYSLVVYVFILDEDNLKKFIFKII